MKKILLFLLIAFSIPAFSQTVYKYRYNVIEKCFDLVSDSVAWADTAGYANAFAMPALLIDANPDSVITKEDGVFAYTVPATGISLSHQNVADSLSVNAVFDSLTVTKLIGDTYSDAVDNVIYPPHAYMRFADSTITASQDSGTWYQVTNAGDSVYRVLEPPTGGMTVVADTIIIPQDGDYLILFDITLDCGANNNAAVRINSTDGELSRMYGGTGAAGEFDAISCTAYYYLANTGDEVWFEYSNITDGDDFNVKSSIVIITYLHP